MYSFNTYILLETHWWFFLFYLFQWHLKITLPHMSFVLHLAGVLGTYKCMCLLVHVLQPLLVTHHYWTCNYTSNLPDKIQALLNIWWIFVKGAVTNEIFSLVIIFWIIIENNFFPVFTQWSMWGVISIYYHYY